MGELMGQKTNDFVDGEVEKALRRALRIINKVSDTEINKATKLMAATNLVMLLLEVDLDALEEEKDDSTEQD